MAKRKTVDGELGEERVTRRSTRGRTVKEEVVDEEMIVEKVKAKGMAVKKSPIKDEESESKEEVKVRIIFILSRRLFFVLCQVKFSRARLMRCGLLF